MIQTTCSRSSRLAALARCEVYPTANTVMSLHSLHARSLQPMIPQNFQSISNTYTMGYASYTVLTFAESAEDLLSDYGNVAKLWI